MVTNAFIYPTYLNANSCIEIDEQPLGLRRRVTGNRGKPWLWEQCISPNYLNAGSYKETDELPRLVSIVSVFFADETETVATYGHNMDLESRLTVYLPVPASLLLCISDSCGIGGPDKVFYKNSTFVHQRSKEEPYTRTFYIYFF